MRMFCVTVFLFLFSGCYLDSRWGDVPGAVVTPVADREENQAAWEENVTAAVDEWGDGLEALGCPRPFVIGEGGHEVRLHYTEDRARGEQWGSGYGSPGEIIEVFQQDPAFQRIVRHELGHAIGLDHVAAEDGPSLMEFRTYVDNVLPYDFNNAACILGCGPCS